MKKSAAAGSQVRQSYKPGLDYSMELVREWGSLGSDSIQNLEQVIGWWEKQPTSASPTRIFGEYNFAAGDKNAKDEIRGAFDLLFPSGHDKMGFADQVGWKNIKDIRAGIETKPTKAIATVVEYNDWHLASATDSLYNSSDTALFRSATGTARNPRRPGRSISTEPGNSPGPSPRARASPTFFRASF